MDWSEMTAKTPQQNRPTSVTVVSWILIVMGALSLVGLLNALGDPQVKERAAAQMARSAIPIPVQYAMSFGGMLVLIVSGAAMLMGENWARFLYVVWTGAGFVVGLVTSPMKLLMLPGGLIYLIFVVLLFRPRANQFFTRRTSRPPSEVA